jgi:hypothetical protein
MNPQILKRNTDIENGIESRLVKTERGFVVGIWDIDCNEPFDGVKIFLYQKENCEEEANNYFDRINS